MAVLAGVYCRICKRPYEDLPYYKDQVGCPVCDIPEGAVMKVYEFECWVKGCSGKGTSLNCVKSTTPGMGYHCPVPGCGKDLTEYKRGKI